MKSIIIGSLISIKIGVLSAEKQKEVPIRIDKIIRVVEKKDFALPIPDELEEFSEHIKKIDAIGKMAYVPMSEELFEVTNQKLCDIIDEIRKLEITRAEKQGERDLCIEQLAVAQMDLTNEQIRITEEKKKLEEELIEYRKKEEEKVAKEYIEIRRLELAKIEELKSRRKKIFDDLHMLRQRGFMVIVEDNREEDVDHNDPQVNVQEAVKQIQAYLSVMKNLHYDLDVLERFFVALR